MHEYPITEQIVKMACKHCQEAGAKKVKEVSLVIGDSSGYIGEAIAMYFDLIAKDTICEGATIEITNIKPKLKCSECGELFYRKLLEFKCPKCGGDGIPSEVGKEFYIDSIAVED